MEYQPIEYSFSDVFVPAKAFRHLPEIRDIEDDFNRRYEYFCLGVLNTVNAGIYAGLITMLS